MKEGINKRLEERFPDYLKEQWSHSAKRKADEIKSFLHQEIERAVAEREKEIVEMIEKTTPTEYQMPQIIRGILPPYMAEQMNEQLRKFGEERYHAALSDIFSLLTKEK